MRSELVTREPRSAVGCAALGLPSRTPAMSPRPAERFFGIGAKARCRFAESYARPMDNGNTLSRVLQKIHENGSREGWVVSHADVSSQLVTSTVALRMSMFASRKVRSRRVMGARACLAGYIAAH